MSDDTIDCTVIALTGPPCAGKSTSVDILRDIGVPCKDTGKAIRERAREEYEGSRDEPTEDYIWDIAQLLRDEHGDAAPTLITEDWIRQQDDDVVCIASIRDEAEAEWLRNNVRDVLVVRIDADTHERAERYVQREIDDDEDVVDTEQINEIREELYERELRESPYPKHDVQIRNESRVQMNEMWRKFEQLVSVLESG